MPRTGISRVDVTGPGNHPRTTERPVASRCNAAVWRLGSDINDTLSPVPDRHPGPGLVVRGPSEGHDVVVVRPSPLPIEMDSHPGNVLDVSKDRVGLRERDPVFAVDVLVAVLPLKVAIAIPRVVELGQDLPPVL